MNPLEKGFLLLSSHLGNPERKPLTAHQLSILSDRARLLEDSLEQRQMNADDLIKLGYSRQMSQQILSLLSEEALLQYYCNQGKKLGCTPITRVSPCYPALLHSRLGMLSPGCLWAKGNLDLLNKPAIALVGSRDLQAKNRVFAERIGEFAAENNWTLVSGNARGADQSGQNACLRAGGNVICIVADELCSHTEKESVLYLSADGFSEPFSAQRALGRNRFIHAMGYITFVAQCTLQKGGTWKGTVDNLLHGWSNVLCFRDGSEASIELNRMGAFLVDGMDVSSCFDFVRESQTLFDL